MNRLLLCLLSLLACCLLPVACCLVGCLLVTGNTINVPAVTTQPAAIAPVAVDPGDEDRSKRDDRALLIGINAYDPPNTLAGCVPDARNVQAYLLAKRWFTAGQVRLLLDKQATAAEIRKGLTWLAANAKPVDRRFLSFSGHGCQMPGASEKDGLFEAVCPQDFDWSLDHAITDADFARAFSPLPKGVLFNWISDSCHSGGLSDTARTPTGYGLPATGYQKNRAFEPTPAIAARIAKARAFGVRTIAARELNVGFLSGCTSGGTSADAVIDGKPCGAFTHAWLARMTADASTPWGTLDNLLRDDLRKAGYEQRPQADGARLARPLLR